ncbi:MAG: hypothetical protein V4695_02850 [Pseudomonadota bacterium]
MSAHLPNKSYAIDQAHLRRARNLARQSGCSVITELEYLHSGTSEELVEHLGKLFGMRPLSIEAMQVLSPAYDLLPLALARRWQCLLFRHADNGALIGVIADPFDPDLQLWLNGQAHSAVVMCLASTADLQKYLQLASGEEIVVNQACRNDDRLAAQNAANLECITIAEDLLRRVMQH